MIILNDVLVGVKRRHLKYAHTMILERRADVLQPPSPLPHVQSLNGMDE